MRKNILFLVFLSLAFVFSITANRIDVTGGGGGGASTSGSDNEVLTDDGAAGITSESNLTFDGSTLTVTGEAHVSGNVGIGTSTPTSILHLFDADPALLFDGSTSGDTDFWIGVTADEEGDNDDYFGIGSTLTKGTLPNISFDRLGRVSCSNWDDPVFIADFTIVDRASETSLAVACYSDTSTHNAYINWHKSHTDTIGTWVETVDTEVIGEFTFFGVDTSPTAEEGAMIQVIQDGAAGAFVPTNMIFSTWSSTAENANQLFLHHDGNVEISGREYLTYTMPR